MSEEEISMVLDTYMYLDYKEADDGMSMAEIVAELSASPDCRKGGIHYGEYQILKEAAKNPEIGDLIIGNQSHLMGYDLGTAACSFQTADKSIMYVVYRGTGDGEWLDNGKGMTEASTIQQEKALSYFETVMEREEKQETGRIVVTGHSKGGNKAQYVTMSTKYDHLLDACYNVDGQGFSETAIAAFKEKWGEEGFESRRQKITGIYGENDYVSVLGHSIVPEENICYIQTPVDKSNFAGYHDIKYMFASRRQNSETTRWENVFSGQRNDYAPERGKLGNYAAELSSAMMVLPVGERDGCAAFLMQIMENSQGSECGINGEKLTDSDEEDFWTKGIPIIKDSLFKTESGASLLDAALDKGSFAIQMQGNVNFMLDEKRLLGLTHELKEISFQLENERIKLDRASTELGRCMRGNWEIRAQLEIEELQLSKAAKKVKEFSEQIDEIISIYKKYDELSANHIHSR